MENKQNKQKKIGRLNARWVLVFSCALLLCIMITFGATMAYYGGMSGGLTGEFILKSGIEFKENVTGNDFQMVEIDSEYIVPGTVINPLCLVTITSGTSNHQQTAVNGLLRASFSTTGDMKDFVSISDAVVEIYFGNSEGVMVDANKVARLIKAPDGYWYAVKDTTATSITNSTLLYEIPCTSNSGVVSLIFKMSVDVNNLSTDGETEFVNDYLGKTATFTANFTVIQAEFYGASATPLDQTYANAKPIFDNPTAA